MPGLRARFWLWLAVLALLVGTFATRVAPDVRIETDLLAMLPEVERDPAVEQALHEFSDQAGRRTLFLVGATADTDARAAAERFAATLRGNPGFADVKLEVQSAAAELAAAALKYRGALLSDADRARLASGHGEAIYQDALRALYSPAAVRATPVADDPLGLTSDFLLGQVPPLGALTVEGGVLATTGEGKHWVLVVATTRDSSFARATMEQVMPAVKAASDEARAAGAEVLASGLLVHAAAAADKAHREVASFGAFSALGTILLLLFVHRSNRPVMMSAGSILLGVMAAFTACQLWFGQVHILTLVFGASLTGVAADYSTYFLTDAFRVPGQWDPRTAPTQVAPGILLGLCTALVAYGTLMATPFPGMRQIAAFSAVGLFTACGCVLCLFPLLRPPQAPAVEPWFERGLRALLPHGDARTRLLLLAALVAALAAGLPRLQVLNELRLLQSSPPELLAGEKRVRALVRNATDSQFFLVSGANPEQVLDHEEDLRRQLDALAARGAIDSYAALTRALPSLRTQDEGAALVQAQVCGARGLLARMLGQLGVDAAHKAAQLRDCEESAKARLTPAAWLASRAAEGYRHLWLPDVGSGASIVTLGGIHDLAALQALAVPGARLVDKVGDISAVMARFQRLVAWIVVFSHAALLLLFSLRYGARDALRVVASPALACLGTLGLFGWAGEPVNLFATFALLLVLGIGIDYAIFLREGRNAPLSSLIAVLVSAATALLSFGVLAFSSTPFIHSIGLTMLCGITLALAGALALVPARSRTTEATPA